MFTLTLAVQWLRLYAFTAGGTGSIPGWGSFTCHSMQPKKKKKRFTYIAYFYFSHPHIVFIFIQLKANSRMNTTFSNSRWAFLILEGSDEFNRHRFSDF